MYRQFSFLDRLILEIDEGISTLSGKVIAHRPYPAVAIQETTLSPSGKRHSQGFMRVDHTGEVCAQALYRSQMLLSRTEKTRHMLETACEEEKDHLAWTQQRLQELGTHLSYLNVFWYTHSFLTGLLAGLLGDRWSLGFVEETERQVSRHLAHHIQDLPEKDLKSRAIAKVMQDDEERHGQQASLAGGVALPAPIKKLMAVQAKVMTTLAYYL